LNRNDLQTREVISDVSDRYRLCKIHSPTNPSLEKMNVVSLLVLIAFNWLNIVVALQSNLSKRTSHAPITRHRTSTHQPLHSTAQDTTNNEPSKRKEGEVSRFLSDFKTARGTLVDPYKVLKISRSATSVEIKQSYRKLSRKWHPDAVARKEILPGNW
jgi:hypothetical protein